MTGMIQDVLDCANETYRSAGIGHLEKFYEEAFTAALTNRGYEVKSQVHLIFEKLLVKERGGYIDLLVTKDGRSLIIELKAVMTVNPVHLGQLQKYMRYYTEKCDGILINFNPGDPSFLASYREHGHLIGNGTGYLHTPHEVQYFVFRWPSEQ